MPDEQSEQYPRFGRRRTIFVVVALAISVSSFLLPASWIESGYSRGLFPWIQACLVPLSGAVPWPLFGTLLALLPILVPTVAVLRWRRGRRAGHSRGALLGHGTLRTLRWLLYLYATFTLLWGLGYRRIPIEARWQLGDEVLEQEHIRDVQARLLAVLHRDSPARINTARANAAQANADEAQAWRAIATAAQDLVVELEGFRPALPAHLKHPPAGTLMALGIYGVISPFTLEANVERALPLPFRLGIGGHELAHVLGYNGEADANLVGWVAGLRADDPLARYASALSVARYAMSFKHLQDSIWFQVNLPQCAKDDMAALRKETKRRRVKSIAKISSAVNDKYLKTQGVKLGTNDYARGFTLFVRAVRKGLVPMPEPWAAPRKKPK